VRDTPYGHDAYDLVRSGQCRGCSVGFSNTRKEWVGQCRGYLITEADLREISLVGPTRKPSWFGTWARAQ
jgi:HK97 family phage prohead protease